MKPTTLASFEYPIKNKLSFTCFGKFKYMYIIIYFTGTYKVRNEIETKRNEINENETKRNETKRNQRNGNEMKRNQRNRLI